MTTVKRNATNRQRGKSWERDIETYARDLGLDADRTRDTGTLDQGDIAIRTGGSVVVVEAKNTAKFTPGPFGEEALREARQFAERRGWDEGRILPVVFVKRRQKGTSQGFALTTIEAYLDLVRRVTE